MPRNFAMQPYLVRFSLADGEHIAGCIAEPYSTDAKKKEVEAEIRRALDQRSAEFPDGNPDFKIIEIKPVKDGQEVYKAAQALNDANPGRIGAEKLGLDTPNRILNEPEITRNLAAMQTPG